MGSITQPLPHLREAIDAQGRRMDWLAGQVGVSQGYLTHIIAGRRGLSDELAHALADALGLTVEFVRGSRPGEAVPS